MRIHFTITFADGQAAEATASVADQVAFELQHDRSIARLGDDFRLTDACWLAWHALKRTNRTSSDFETWLENVDELEVGQGNIVPLGETTTLTGS